MLLSALNSMNYFTGIARIDYKKTEAEINKCPPHTREAIWGNINTLKDRFEKGPDKAADISFEYRASHDTIGWQGVGKIKVKGENQATSQEFDLRKYTTPQEIWEDGFESITQRVLDDSFDTRDKETDRKIDEYYMAHKDGRIGGTNYGYLRVDAEQARSEIYDIADKLVQTPKVKMDRHIVAAEIYMFMRREYKNQNEVTNCLINNFNQIVQKFEENLPEGKYQMSLDYGSFSCSHDDPGHYYVKIEQLDKENKRNPYHLVGMWPGSTWAERKDGTKGYAYLDNIDESFQKLYDGFVWRAWND